MGVVYSALREKDEIRLLRLLPGSGSEPVRCTLIHARLGESPTYDALSYMWGLDRPGKNCLLQVDDGRTLEVRENLGNALRYLRLKDKVRVLWVDAICINQADDAERGHQVAQMGMIYSQAFTVRIWLGIQDEHSAHAFRFLKNLDTIRNMKRGQVVLHEWAAVARLCMREYWQRLWIIQEVVLAARIEIHCGETVLQWDDFSQTLCAFQELYNIGLLHGTGTAMAARIVGSAAMKICQQRCANTESGPATELASLLSLLWTHKDAKCVDVRDKVFGMHSFAPECCRAAIPVDYQCTAYTLCRRLLDHDIYFHSDGRRNGGKERIVRRSLDLHGLIVQGAHSQLHSKNPFEVGSPESAELQEKTSNLQIPNPLMVLGHELGQVHFVTAPLATLFIEEEAVLVPRAMIKSFEELKFGCDDAEDPNLTACVTKGLGKIWRSKEMDILSSLSHHAPLYMEMVDMNDPGPQGDLDITAVHNFQKLVRFCSEFLRASHDLGIKPVYEDCVLYLARAELGWGVGFAPTGTKAGDLVCTFKQTTIIALVRDINGDRTMVGQGSRIDELGSKGVPFIPSQSGNIVNIQFDLPTLQMFSRMAPRCKLGDYRVILTIPPTNDASVPKIPPRQIVRRGQRLSVRNLSTVLRESFLRGERLTIPFPENNEARWPDDGKDPPEYTSEEIPSVGADMSKYQGRSRKFGIKIYMCPRCKATCTTSRDNLAHASTWAHQQCEKCKCWTSWQSSTSVTSSTPFCTQCRVNDPSCAVDLPDLLHEEARYTWWKEDLVSLATDDSVRDSIASSSDMSSNSTAISDITIADPLDRQVGIPKERLPYSHTRRHFCGEQCKLFSHTVSGTLTKIGEVWDGS
jgi:hypothetical protein